MSFFCKSVILENFGNVIGYIIYTWDQNILEHKHVDDGGQFIFTYCTTSIGWIGKKPPTRQLQCSSILVSRICKISIKTSRQWLSHSVWYGYEYPNDIIYVKYQQMWIFEIRISNHEKIFDITRFLSRNSHDNIVWMQKSNKEFQLKIGICRIRISQ